MPRITPLSEIKELDHDQVVTCVVGTIKTIYEQKTGESNGKPWAIQNLTISDGTTTLDVMNKGEEISKAWKGRKIIIEAHHGERGWTGVYASDDDYKGKVTRKLRLTSTATVSLYEETGGGEHEHEPEPERQPARQTTAARPPQQQAPPPAKAPAPAGRPRTEHAPAPKPGSVGAMQFVNGEVTQAANLLLVCIGKVQNYVAPAVLERTGLELSAEECQKHATSLFIQMARDGMLIQMPKTEFVFRKPAAPAEPPPAPEPAREQAPVDDTRGNAAYTDPEGTAPQDIPF